MPGLLCLKWNNHSSAFDKLLTNIHLKEVYSDGTLVCHGKFYPVHKFVLSTCSEYFDEIFKQCLQMECKHPFIIVKDIQPLQMEALLNYMYRGEVNVPQEMLPDLIKAAEAFKIKGLAVPDDDPPPVKGFSRDRKRNSISPTPSSHFKKSKKYEDKNCRSTCSKTNLDEINIDNDLPNNTNIHRNLSSSAAKDNTELENTELEDIHKLEAIQTNVGIVKSEPIDVSDFSVEATLKQNNPLEGFLSLEDSNLKAEDQSYDSYTSAENFPPYEEESNQDTSDQFDMAQSSSWGDHHQEFESEENVASDDPQRIFQVSSMIRGTQGSPLEAEFSEKTLIERNNQEIFENSQKSASNNININQLKRRFHCTFCPYKASRKHHLSYHLKTHTGEKPYSCPFCSYRCIEKFLLNQHIRVHDSGEKPFKCQHCDYNSVRKQNLKEHIFNKHGHVTISSKAPPTL